MAIMNLWHGEPLWKRGSIHNCILIIFITVAFLCICNISLAADKDTLWKYQVVAGSDDQAYLVDTTTGAVWILTYRTMPTGREPIAIPYKFIKISPKNQKDFLVESPQKEAPMPTADGP
jgi:hypothetical protein